MMVPRKLGRKLEGEVPGLATLQPSTEQPHE
jgi:hypothetical protein